MNNLRKIMGVFGLTFLVFALGGCGDGDLNVPKVAVASNLPENNEENQLGASKPIVAGEFVAGSSTGFNLKLPARNLDTVGFHLYVTFYGISDGGTSITGEGCGNNTTIATNFVGAISVEGKATSAYVYLCAIGYK